MSHGSDVLLTASVPEARMRTWVLVWLSSGLNVSIPVTLCFLRRVYLAALQPSEQHK